MLGGLGRVEPTLRARAPLSLAPYNPTLQWSGWAESNVLQHHFVAALQRAVGLTFSNPILQWAERVEPSALHPNSVAALAMGCGPCALQPHPSVVWAG